MINRIIGASFRAPLLTILLISAGAAVGAVWMQDLRRDVFPDLSAPVFNIIAQNKKRDIQGERNLTPSSAK